MKHLQVRLSEKLLKRLQRLARDNYRSMNSEIIFRLEQSLTRPKIEREYIGTAEGGDAYNRGYHKGYADGLAGAKLLPAKL